MTKVAPDDRHRRRSWLTNAGWLTAANLLSVAISAVVGLALVRAFGATDLGRYSLASVAAVIGAAIVGFRLDQHLLTRLNRDAEDEHHFAVAVRSAYAVYVPVAAVIAVAMIVVFRGTDRLIGLLALLEVGLTPLLFPRVVLQVRMRQRDALACTAVSRLSWLVAVGVLIAFERVSVPAVLVARAMSTVVEIGCLARATGFSVLVVVRKRASRAELLGALRASLPLASSGLAGEFNGRVDQPLLAAFKGPTELGIYAAAVRVADLAGVLAPVAQTVVAPSMVDAARKGDARAFDAVLRDGLIVTLVPSAWLVAMAMGQSDWIVKVLAGPEFDAAASLVVIIAAGEWMTMVGGAFSVALLALGQRRNLAIASGVGLAVNLIGNAIWMPSYGATAAAWMTLVGWGAASLVAIFASREVRRGLRSTLPVVAASAASIGASAAVVWMMRSNRVGSIATGSLLYAVVTVALLRTDVFRAVRAMRRTAVAVGEG